MTTLHGILAILRSRDQLSPIEEYCPWVGMKDKLQALSGIF